MNEAPRKRRALTHLGGKIETEGDSSDAKLLAHALEVAPSTDDDDDPSRGHVHGFHTYPARMHPVTAARLVEAFSPAGGRVLDPFCGSGTVLVEALLLGRNPIGTDLNPLAVELARCKTRPRTVAELEHLIASAEECAVHADERRKAKAGATRRFLVEDMHLFEPHVLLELDSIRAKIETLRDDPARPDLLLVLSALLVKFSKLSGDTSEKVSVRRTAAGAVARFFVRKTEDLARRLGEFTKMLPSPLPEPAFVEVDDAAKVRKVPRWHVDAIITSPPYAATYDYVAHHALRLRWLGIDATRLSRAEIGARSAYARLDPRKSKEKWSEELTRFLRATAGMLDRGSPLVLLMGDSAVGNEALRADEIVAAESHDAGFIAAARASQPRPHFHGATMAAFRDRPRAEHAIVLRRK